MLNARSQSLFQAKLRHPEGMLAASLSAQASWAGCFMAPSLPLPWAASVGAQRRASQQRGASERDRQKVTEKLKGTRKITYRVIQDIVALQSSAILPLYNHRIVPRPGQRTDNA